MAWEWTWYTWAWLAWFAFGVGLELYTLFNKDEDDTLSAHVIFLMRSRKVFRITITLFLVWLVIHWATGGWI